MALSATLHGDFPHNDFGSMRDRPKIGTLIHCLPVQELVFCSLLMILAATSHWDFPHNVVGSVLPVCGTGISTVCTSVRC